jgi:hypothetical protein
MKELIGPIVFDNQTIRTSAEQKENRLNSNPPIIEIFSYRLLKCSKLRTDILSARAFMQVLETITNEYWEK